MPLLCNSSLYAGLRIPARVYHDHPHEGKRHSHSYQCQYCQKGNTFLAASHAFVLVFTIACVLVLGGGNFDYIGSNPLTRTRKSIKTGIISRRPIHMFNINITFPMYDIPAFVIPVDNPTFPCAEATSNMTSPN